MGWSLLKAHTWYRPFCRALASTGETSFGGRSGARGGLGVHSHKIKSKSKQNQIQEAVSLDRTVSFEGG